MATPAPDPAAMEAAFAHVRRALEVRPLPLVEESTWYGTPSLKLGKKSLCRVKDADTLVVRCPIEEKEHLLAAEPGLLFETDHYKGYPAHLIRLAAISPERLRARLAVAWRMQATKTMLKAHEGEL